MKGFNDANLKSKQQLILWASYFSFCTQTIASSEAAIKYLFDDWF